MMSIMHLLYWYSKYLRAPRTVLVGPGNSLALCLSLIHLAMTVAETIRRALDLGVSVKMITGVCHRLLDYICVLQLPSINNLFEFIILWITIIINKYRSHIEVFGNVLRSLYMKMVTN